MGGEPVNYKANLTISNLLPPDSTVMSGAQSTTRPIYEAVVLGELNDKMPAGPPGDWTNLGTSFDPSESQVSDLIVSGLAIYNNSQTTRKLSLVTAESGNEAVPLSVRYVWRNGKLVRVHSYALALSERAAGEEEWSTPEDWTVAAASITTPLCAELTLDPL